MLQCNVGHARRFPPFEVTFPVRFLALAAAGVLAACSGSTTGNKATPADVNAAAAEAQGDIDTYAANQLSDRAPVVAASPVRMPGRDTPVAAKEQDDPAAPNTVVRAYFAAIAAHDYAAAYRLWEDDGAASGLSPRAFGASFAKYATFDAEVGNRGPIEAGAGQRDVVVPVRVRGTLAASGQPFVLAGPVALHRTVADGASSEQRNWRIRDTALRPEPTRATATDARPCAGDARVTARADGGSGQERVWQRAQGGRLASGGRDAAPGERRLEDCAPAM